MFRSALLAWIVAFAAGSASAQEFKVEKVEAAAPTDGVAAEITALLAPTGFKLVKGASRTVCEIWLCNEWPISPAAKTSG